MTDHITRQQMTLNLQALKRIDPDDPANNSDGICWALSRQLKGTGYQALTACLFELWEEWSGSYSYPVPSFEDGETAEDAYEHCETMFREHEYGQARRRLLAHMIKTLEECLEC